MFFDDIKANPAVMFVRLDSVPQRDGLLKVAETFWHSDRETGKLRQIFRVYRAYDSQRGEFPFLLDIFDFEARRFLVIATNDAFQVVVVLPDNFELESPR